MTEETEMAREFEVRWAGDLPATPSEAWDAFTRRTAGWIWEIEYEPRVGGAERGLSPTGGIVTAWDPPRHFATRSERDANELDYRLEPSGEGTRLTYVHRGAIAGDYDVELDACQRHTAFYNHSLGEYLRHFAGRDAVYVSVDAPESSADGGSAALRAALGLGEGVAVGDRVRLAPAGLEPIEGVVDYASDPFVGIRTDDALIRIYGRDEWGWPVGVAVHLFRDGVDKAAVERAWDEWLQGVFATEEVA